MSGLLRQVGVQALGAGFCAAVSFVLLMWLGRVLGAEEFGRYVLLLNVATLGLVLIEGGWPTLVYRQGAREGINGAEALQYVRSAAFHALSVAAVLIALALSFDFALAVALGCMLSVAAMNLVSARMRADVRFALEAGWQSLGRVLSACAIWWVVSRYNATNSEAIFVAWSAGLLVVLLCWGHRWLLLPSTHGWLMGWRAVWPFLLIAGLTTWMLKGDVVLLGVLVQGADLPVGELSWYAAGTRLTEAFLLLAAPLGNVLLGRFSRMAVSDNAQEGKARLRKQAIQVSSALLLGGGLAILMGFVAGDWLLVWLFGAEFSPAGSLLPWVLLMLPFALGNVVLFALLTSLGQERALVICMLLGSVVLLLLVPVLGGHSGAIGAALAMALAHALVFIVGWWVAGKALRPRADRIR